MNFHLLDTATFFVCNGQVLYILTSNCHVSCRCLAKTIKYCIAIGRPYLQSWGPVQIMKLKGNIKPLISKQEKAKYVKVQGKHNFINIFHFFQMYATPPKTSQYSQKGIFCTQIIRTSLSFCLCLAINNPSDMNTPRIIAERISNTSY